MSNSANNDTNNNVNENYIQTDYGCVDKVFNEDNLEEYRERYNENLDSLWNNSINNDIFTIEHYGYYGKYDDVEHQDHSDQINRINSELANKNVVMCSFLKFLSKEVSNNFDKIMERIEELEERMEVLEERISSS